MKIVTHFCSCTFSFESFATETSKQEMYERFIEMVEIETPEGLKERIELNETID